MSHAGSTGRALLLLGVVCAGAGPSLAADRLVSTLGSDIANDCLSSLMPCGTIGHALTQAASGDTIKLAQGGYVESSLTVSGTTTLAISGGWSADFATQSAAPVKTTIDARFQGPVFVVTAAGTTIDLTLDTVTITKGGDRGIQATSTGAGSLTLTVANSVLRHNKTSVTSGGAIGAVSLDTSSLDVILTNSRFKANRGGNAGAIRLASANSSASSLAATGSTFVANISDAGSGAITAHGVGTTPLSVVIDDCKFKSNHGGYPTIGNSLSAAGAIGLDGLLDASVVNSVFQANRGTGGGALRLGSSLEVAAGDVSITNSTFRRNKASSSGGAIRVFLSNGTAFNIDIRNTLLWGNSTGGLGQDLRVIDDSGLVPVDVDHSDLGDVSGPYNDLGGNISADPHVMADCHVRSDSPAIDAGTCSGAPATDFEGDVRPTGVSCDMGADEFVP